jgi:phosphoenolpyruvate-protein kinase (PTS system EI component)
LVKERLRSGSMRQFRALADRALACPDAAAVRALLAEDLSAHPAGGTAR